MAWPMTARCQATLAKSHVEFRRVDVLHDGLVVKSLGGTGTTLPPVWDEFSQRFVPALDVSVNVARQQIRRDGSASFLDLDGVLTPSDSNDLFVPMIADLRIFAGVQFWDATPGEIAAGKDVEWIPLGTLVVTDVDGEWPVRVVSGYDRLWHCTPFVGNWPIIAGTPLDQVLTDILSDQIPAGKLELDIPQTEFTAQDLMYVEQTNSLDVVHQVAAAMGLVLYSDPMGKIVARSEPTTEDPPAFTYAPGPTSMLLRPKRGVSARDAVNVVVFTGEDDFTGTAVRGVAEDNDPNSITYVGRVKRRPAFLSSPLVKTFPQAQLAAKTSLTRLIGVPDTTAVPVVPNPALELGDVIKVTDFTQGIDFPLITEAFPVGGNSQEITTRSRVIR